MKTRISTIKTITIRELSGYFTSPLAYVFIVIYLLMSGFFTFKLGNLFQKNEVDLSTTFFVYQPWLYLLLIPAVAMRLWSEEYKSGTVELLFTLPVTVAEAVTAKFLAAWSVVVFALLLTVPVVITVARLGEPDFGVIVAGYVSSILLSGVFLSIGSFTSSMTRNQVVSFIVSLVICLLMILVSFPPITDFFTSCGWFPVWFIDSMAYAGIFEHFNNLNRGLLDMRDIAYFLSVIIVFLVATGISLVSRRTAI